MRTRGGRQGDEPVPHPPPLAPAPALVLSTPSLELQRAIGYRAASRALQSSRHLQVQREPDDLDPEDGADLRSGRSRPRTQGEARALVDRHVSPARCFIELENARAGWRPISGTGCAHWVAHQLGRPTGTAAVCQEGLKYRVVDLLATLRQVSADLQAAQVGDVWSATGSSHVGLVRAVTRGSDGGVTSVEVENDSSRSGGVVRQTKTDGSVHRP